MKSASRVIVLCTAILVPGMALSTQTPSIIEPKVERHQGPPLWISAGAVADAEKIIDLDRISSDSLRRRVEKQRLALGDRLPAEKYLTGEKPSITTIPASECKSMSYLEDDRGGGGSSATLSDLMNHSRSIIRGTVRTVDLGFAFGSPSSLLGVEVSEVIQGPAPSSPFYVDYPVARFRIGPFHFCNLNKGFEPSPGDEILLFDFTGPVDRENILYAPRLDQLFFQSQSGTLFLPPSLKNTTDLKTARTFSDVIDRIRSHSKSVDPQESAR